MVSSGESTAWPTWVRVRVSVRVRVRVRVRFRVGVGVRDSLMVEVRARGLRSGLEIGLELG